MRIPGTEFRDTRVAELRSACAFPERSSRTPVLWNSVPRTHSRNGVPGHPCCGTPFRVPIPGTAFRDTRGAKLRSAYSFPERSSGTHVLRNSVPHAHSRNGVPGHMCCGTPFRMRIPGTEFRDTRGEELRYAFFTLNKPGTEFHLTAPPPLRQRCVTSCSDYAAVSSIFLPLCGQTEPRAIKT